MTGGLDRILLVTKLTGTDFLRRKDFYVVAIFMALFGVAAVAVRLVGIEKAATAQLLMGLGLSLAQLLSACLAAAFSARALPEEFENRTLLPLLAKPVGRGQVLAGKALACLGIAAGAYLLFAGLVLATVPLTGGQRLTALAQVLTLGTLALLLVSAMAFTLSLYSPIVLAALLSLGWFYAGGFLLGLIEEALQLQLPDALAGPLAALTGLLPRPGLLRHVECFASSSQTLAAGHFLALAAYGLAWSAFLYLWAAWRFRRMPI